MSNKFLCELYSAVHIKSWFWYAENKWLHLEENMSNDGFPRHVKNTVIILRRARHDLPVELYRIMNVTENFVKKLEIYILIPSNWKVEAAIALPSAGNFLVGGSKSTNGGLVWGLVCCWVRGTGLLTQEKHSIFLKNSHKYLQIFEYFERKLIFSPKM